MNTPIINCVQGSPEWFAARVGKVTASRLSDVMAKNRAGTGWGVTRTNYIAELVAERLTGVSAERFSSAEMQRGNEVEPDARAAYEFWRNVDVEQVGFIPHQTIGDTGASPDGLVGTLGLVEIKCPNTATHIETLLGGSIKGTYVLQMQWQMACTGRQWCDFASYDPRMPETMRLFVQRVERDAEVIASLESGVVEFLKEVRETEAKLRAKFDMAEPLPDAVKFMMAG